MSRRKKARGVKRRKQGNRTRLKTLILCEGKNTEKDYFDRLIDFLKLNQTIKTVAVQGVGKQLKTVVQEAGKVKRDAEEVWCVVDRESPQSLPESKLLDQLAAAKQKGLFVALSNTCFEFWYLLHFEYTTQSFADCGEVVSQLKKKHGTEHYGKNSAESKSIATRLANLNQYGKIAITNAQRVRQHHITIGNSPNATPSTDVDLLVCRLISQSVSYQTPIYTRSI